MHVYYCNKDGGENESCVDEIGNGFGDVPTPYHRCHNTSCPDHYCKHSHREGVMYLEVRLVVGTIISISMEMRYLV